MVFRLVPCVGPTLVLALSLGALGCQKRAKSPDAIGVSSHLELAEQEKQDEEADEKHVGPNVVPDAAREFTGYRAADDRSFERESFLTHLASADAICIGEDHDAPLDHYAELALLEALVERRPMRGVELGLALEMVRTHAQPSLTDFADGDLTLAEFTEKEKWAEEWGFPIEYYSHQLEAAKRHRVTLLGVGVRRDLTSHVAESGIEGLTPLDQRQLPDDLDFLDAEHRALFDALMAGHPHGDPNKLYAAQVVWDESMAESSAAYLKGRAPGRKLIIFAGKAHCHRLAIPKRLARRGRFEVVSVVGVERQPVRPRALTKDSSAEDRLLSGYDYQIVFSEK